MIQIPLETSLLKCIQNQRQVGLPLRRVSDAESALVAMVCRLRRCVLLVPWASNLACKSLQDLKPGLNVLPGEGIVAHFSSPLVIVVPSSDGVHAEVDGRATAETFSTGIVEFTAATVLLWSSLVAPIHIGFHECYPALAGDSERLVIIALACF